MSVTVTFHGACGTVTGSCFEVRNDDGGILIDCGMFQGTKTVKALNYEAFPFAASSITAVALTHAHIDHCGLLPRLTKVGFGGSIYCSAPTADLISYVLPDSGYIQELEVERLNHRNRQRGLLPVTPIYTHSDAEHSLAHVRACDMDAWVAVAPGMRMRLWNAGHILGSASIELRVASNQQGEELALLFSGDLGPGDKPFHGAPSAPAGIDYLFVESTYGSRVREVVTNGERRAKLGRELKAGLGRGGIILVPAFAVERTQELLSDLAQLMAEGAIPETPIFVDTPLATRATAVFDKYVEVGIGSERVTFVQDVTESRNLNRISGGAIILAGSGMCDAGRIRHHLKARLHLSSTTVLLVGYQAPGTLGNLLESGRTRVRIQGDEVVVAAHIARMDDYSGHADQAKLVEWIEGRLPVRAGIFVVHGEEESRTALIARLAESEARTVKMLAPTMGDTLKLTPAGSELTASRPRLSSPSAVSSDWHNQLAELSMQLRARLERATSEPERARLLTQIQKIIG